MRSPELRKLTYVLTILVVVTNGFAVLMFWFFHRQLQSPIVLFPSGEIPGGMYYQVIPPLFVFIELTAVIWVYWPFEPQLIRESPVDVQNRNRFILIFAGVGSGLLLFILFIPFLLRTKPENGTVSLILYYNKSLTTYINAVLIAIALPLASETVFKGIVFKILLRHTSPLSSLLITSLSFALIWPVFHGYWFALGLGAVTSLLYYYYRTIIVPMTAHITFTSAVFGFLALRVVFRH